MSDSVGVPLVVYTRQDDNLSAVNNILRQAGHPVHCLRAGQLGELNDALKHHHPELILYFADEKPDELESIVKLLRLQNPSPTLLLVCNKIDEQTISAAMESGANDVISLTHRYRFQAVVKRELSAYRLKVALASVVSSAQQYRQELKTLMQGSAEAIADVQEGIIVASNPNWAELFGYKDTHALMDTPFMDSCAESDQTMIKGALVACLKQNWDGAPLKMTGLHANGSNVPVEIQLERVTIAGDPAVRVIVAGDNTAERPPEQLLEQTLLKDPVTGFYHRHYFIDKVEEHLQTPLSGGVRAMVYIRPDNFARVHDDIGILATEKLLTRLADLLKGFMQPPDLYGRFGGTMFIALLERGTMEDIQTWTEQLRKTIAEHVFEVDDQSTSLTCTIGMSAARNEEQTTAELLHEVEKACRAGRDSGGNCVNMCEDTGATQAIRTADALWVPRLRSALMQNRLKLMHQTITGLTEEVAGIFDTRVQMIDEVGDTVLASEFIPAAERAGIIKNIDRWVIGASLSFCQTENPMLVFLRLSADSINDDSLPDWLNERMDKSQVKPTKICFQVSEEIAAQFLKQTISIAEALRAKGFKFAIDHLGSGRDSDQVLKHIPMDYMKIDGNLMQGLHREPEAQKVVGDLVRTATDLNIKTIAERIEDANTLATLWQLGIGLIQGNYVQMQGVVLEDTQSVRKLVSEH
ncbi:MAG TPA: EAL domain-containing protein [Gammaproteobacteria bacterium]|nr:EAL domain-containing protein [Gammaproteobacteria bacterium]MDP7297190.1 EAL domain-containing protein [Gammaproteobacteria bacterium]MDP7661134.1 EAL domain-containing protein [Gammaproteobacteria bacterium]HJP39240.1 EAL domain-containing protein [Gammaproteobacteria bacterium]